VKVEISGAAELEMRALAKRYKKSYQAVISHAMQKLWELEQTKKDGKSFEDFSAGRIPPGPTRKPR
jgi:hypothetical protein